MARYAREPEARFELLHLRGRAGPVADLEPRRWTAAARGPHRQAIALRRSPIICLPKGARASTKPAQVFGRRAPLPGMTNRRLHPPRLGLLAALVLLLVYVSAASTASTPLLQLGPIAVANDTATVTGTLASGSSTATLTINGQPVGLDAAGAFAAAVPLNGASTLSLALRQGGPPSRRPSRSR